VLHEHLHKGLLEVLHEMQDTFFEVCLICDHLKVSDQSKGETFIYVLCISGGELCYHES